MSLTEKQMLWLNDVSLPAMTPKEEKAVLLDSFRSLREMGIAPGQVKDDEMRKQYAAWLEANPE